MNKASRKQEHARNALPLRRDDLVLEELDGEAILYDPRYGAAHRFNAVTLFVWDLCDGSHTTTDIAQRLTKLCEVDPGEALESVQRVIAELSTLDLVQGVPLAPINKTKVPWWTRAPSEPVAPFIPSTVGPPEELRLSRRELLGSGMGKLIFVAPVISTFFATGAYASGPSASGAFGEAGCKTIGYSCAVATDCCEGAADTDCEGGSCCLDPGEAGCNIDADCCQGKPCLPSEKCQN